ncbi:MAG: hypothetical protein HYS39_04025 [Proteobacteria bacterium]|nr:hypothetical protein [Pseudomonadota bacterium]
MQAARYVKDVEKEQKNFLKLFTEQLKNQTPDDPMDAKDVLNMSYQLNFLRLASDMSVDLKNVSDGVQAIRDNLLQTAETSSAVHGAVRSYNGQEFQIKPGDKSVALNYYIENSKDAKEVLDLALMIEDSSGKIVKQINDAKKEVGANAVHIMLSSEDKDSLKEGKYKFSVVATDINHNKLEVGAYSVDVSPKDALLAAIPKRVANAKEAADKVVNVLL